VQTSNRQRCGTACNQQQFAAKHFLRKPKTYLFGYRWSGALPGPKSGVDNAGWGKLCPLPRKKLFLKWRVLVHFERAIVWRLPCYNSLQFWCVNTVTNRFYYRNCLTLYSHLKFPSRVYHSTPIPHTKFIHFNITRTKTSSADLHQYQEHEHSWQKWCGHVHPSPPGGDAPADEEHRPALRRFCDLAPF